MDNGGTIFRIAPDGTFMTLHRLAFAEGTRPSAGPIIGADGKLYGAGTYGGGASGAVGSVFCLDSLAAQPARLSMSKYCHNEFNTCFKPINTWVGEAYDIIWNSANLGQCVASGAWAGTKPPGGRLQFVATRPGLFTYRLACIGPGDAQECQDLGHGRLSWTRAPERCLRPAAAVRGAACAAGRQRRDRA